MYQVIYSSVVIWCAILSYLTMGRTLTTTQWVAIFGTSVGLAISALGNTSQGDGKDLLVKFFVSACTPRSPKSFGNS
jgi:drug/metabolite transporter (DMT)-like permease